jgi:hypothetical protein
VTSYFHMDVDRQIIPLSFLFLKTKLDKANLNVSAKVVTENR